MDIETGIMVAFAVAGFGTITYGVGRLSAPAGWVVFGCCCLVTALWPMLRDKWLS